MEIIIRGVWIYVFFVSACLAGYGLAAIVIEKNWEGAIFAIAVSAIFFLILKLGVSKSREKEEDEVK